MALLQSISKQVDSSARDNVEDTKLPATELDTIQVELNPMVNKQRPDTSTIDVIKDIAVPKTKNGAESNIRKSNLEILKADGRLEVDESRARRKTILARKCHSAPVLPTRENEFGFDNFGFDADVDPHSLRFADVVSMLIHDQLKEDLHPFGRGNLYKSALDESRTPSVHHDEGKMFMWAIATLVILAIVGSAIIMSIMYRQDMALQDVNSTTQAMTTST